LDESGGICERKTLFWMKKEADQAGFKDTRSCQLTLMDEPNAKHLLLTLQHQPKRNLSSGRIGL